MGRKPPVVLIAYLLTFSNFCSLRTKPKPNPAIPLWACWIVSFLILLNSYWKDLKLLSKIWKFDPKVLAFFELEPHLFPLAASNNPVSQT